MKENNTAITGMIKLHAEQTPGKTALVINDVAYSYRELFRRICSAAAFLSSRGVKNGTHVVTVACPEIEYISCEYAILGLGAVNIPTENRIPPDRLAEVAQAVDAELVISKEKPPCAIDWFSCNEIDYSAPADHTWETSLVSDDCSEIIFTTGTTGKSKGVMLSSRCLETYLNAINPSFGLEERSVFLVTTPLNHVGGLHRVHQCMYVGCTAVLLDGIKNLKAFFHSIYDYGVTHTYLPPASIKLLLSLARKELAALNGKLQFIYTASAPFPTPDMETLVKLLPDTRLHQGYGSSETGSICNCRYNAPGETLTSLGKPYPCVEVMLHDENGELIREPNREGFIRSRSGMNMIGYYKDPELTASVLRDGFIYSNDLLFFDEKGELHFAGRGDDVINIRGFKVAPTEIENAVLNNDAIADCACIPFEDPTSGKVLKLFVVMKEGAPFSAGELASYLEQRLEPYKIPKFFQCLSEIPKTYNGKVDRKKLISGRF